VDSEPASAYGQGISGGFCDMVFYTIFQFYANGYAVHDRSRQGGRTGASLAVPGCARGGTRQMGAAKGRG